MFEKPQFHIETVETGLNYGRYKVEPLEPGYGTTLGNALRRILLRSLEGVAVSRVRIDGVWHEFSTVNNVREDVTEIVLNLKRIRLKRMLEINGDVRAHLYVRGDGTGDRVVTAGDIAWPSEVDVINPEQPIATLASPDAVLDMDLWVTRDRGYRPAEAQETYSLGEIPIDAIFTPIQKVNFVVEHTRVGQMTDFDRLILEILTDGTIEPDDALGTSRADPGRSRQGLRRLQPQGRRGRRDRKSVHFGRSPEQGPLRTRSFAAGVECPAQPPDRQSRSGADDGPGSAALDPQFRAALADRIASEAGGVWVSARERSQCLRWGRQLHGRSGDSMATKTMTPSLTPTMSPRRLPPCVVMSGSVAGPAVRRVSNEASKSRS